MSNISIFKKIFFISTVAMLLACGDNSVSTDNAELAPNEPDVNVPVQVDKKKQIDSEKEIQRQKLEAKKEALQNPNWVPVSNLPAEWTGLYQKECKIGGPEGSHFFEYQNHETNMIYYFAHISYPPSLNKKPKANVYPVTYKVWQNDNWPDHYLLFGQDSFMQLLREDGWVKGMHQTLDGQPWDIAQHMQTKYRETDVVRWAADVHEDEDYGSHPPCDPKLAQPWQGQVFKTREGRSLTLQQAMGQ